MLVLCVAWMEKSITNKAIAVAVTLPLGVGLFLDWIGQLDLDWTLGRL